MYKIIIWKKITKFLKKHKWEKIVYDTEKAIFTLRVNPYKNPLDIKPLQWFENTYRVRLGKYRLIYEVFEQKIEIHFLELGSRGEVYK